MSGTNRQKNFGFTLIEMMVVVSIIGILAAIAIPSYRRYVVVNAERETQAKMLQLELQLERWRARALTYQGFMPQKGKSGFGYDDTENTIIYVPDGSSANNYRYQIMLVDGDLAPASLVPQASAEFNPTTGQSWKMLAMPNEYLKSQRAQLFMDASTGLRCKSNNTNITIKSSNCGTGQETW